MKAISPASRTLVVLITLLLAHAAGATTFVWNVASPSPNNWNVDANWLPGAGNPGSADTALFGDVGTAADAFTVNNVVSVSTAITALSYTNSLAGTWHVTEIPAGNTLSASGTVTIGGVAANNLNTSVAMAGGGTFLAAGNSFTIGNAGSANPLTPGTLDLSNLSNFVYSASSGTLGIAATGSRAMGTLTLAATSNSITAGTININGATGTGSTPMLNLGGGTNSINVNTFNVGGGRSTTTVQFSSGDGGLRLRGSGGTDADRCNMTVGNRNTGGTGTLTTTGNVLLNGHPVDLKFDTLTLGRMSRNTSGSENNFHGVGNFQFDQGVVDATTIAMGVISGTTTNSRATGTLTVGAGGSLVAGAISLANASSGAASSRPAGTLSISGGTATVSGSIIKTTTTGSTGTVEVLSSGSLSVQGTIGSSANPIDNFNLSDANLTIAASGTVTNVAVLNFTTGGATNVINLSFLPGVSGYPAQLPLIAYSGSIGGAGFDNNIGLGTLPPASPSYAGYLSNNTAASTIDLVITAGPAPAQPITWTGLTDGDWDTSKLNWRAGLIPTNYNNAGDFVTFDDVGLNTTINLVTPALTPGSITVSNSVATYTFTGSGKLSGGTGLTKQGAGTLNIANSAINDFTGPISVEGTLAYDQGANATIANPISGPGALAKNGANTLTLSGGNTFAGGLTVNAGAVRLNAANNGGTGSITANSNGVVVFSAAQTNAGIILAGGTFGSSLNLNPLVDDLTAAPGTTSLLYMADPQNLTPADGNETAFSGTWHGSGTVIVATVPNDPSPDGGNGFRLRGTAASDFSGTLALSNRVKGELQTTVTGPFSPAGTGKLVLHGGVLTNNTLTGTYSELNLRNNSTGSTVFGNDVELAGTGLAVLDPLGSAPAGSTITMGNLKIGGGQELGVNLNGSGPDHPVVFPTVTLTGGNAWFSPKTIGWNTTPQIGSDLVLGNITEQVAGSGITMVGLRTLSLVGTNTYTGSTTVSNGTLRVSGTLNGGGTIRVAGGTLLANGSSTGRLIVDPAGTIAPGESIGKFTTVGIVTLNGTNVMEIDRPAGTNDVLQSAGTITYGGTLVVSNPTGPLQAGDSFKLYHAANYSGSFDAIIPETPGADLIWNTGSLTTDGTLKVASTLVTGPYITSVVVSGSDLIVSGTNGTAGGNYYVLTSTNISSAVSNWTSILTQAFDGVNFSFTNAINPADPQRFFLLQLP